MKFPGYRVAPTSDGRILVTLEAIDETQLIFGDDEAKDFVKSQALLSEIEVDGCVDNEPNPFICGDNIHIYGRFIINSICDAYIKIHSNEVDANSKSRLIKRVLGSDQVEGSSPTDNTLCEGNEYYIETWWDVEKLSYWLVENGPY